MTIKRSERDIIMTQWKLKSKRKSTGRQISRHGKKERQQRSRDYLPAHVGKTKRKKVKARGNIEKTIAVSIDTANVVTKNGIKKAEIKTVIENPANPQFVRRNIITKGAIIETSLGNARVTSEPGQAGVVNAILLEK
jgi:small subunit ribosomal protein S8e